MNSNIEIEAKVLLKEADYNKIINKLSLDQYKKIKQTNHYIDSDDRYLKQNSIALRIREKDDFVLTLKTPLSEGLLEKNVSLTWKNYEELKDNGLFPECEIKTFLEILGIKTSTLKILASLTTERIEIPYKSGTLCLDKNIYNGTVDYELEFEDTSMSKAEEVINELLGSLKISYTFNKVSKQARALNNLNK